MKKILIFSLIVTLFICIFAAGCLSLSTTTADIVIGDTKIGTITTIPHNDKLFTNSGIDEKFDVEIEIFGIKYSKEGITLSEKNQLVSSLSSGNLSEINFNDFTKDTPSSESVLDSIINMKLSAENETTLSEALGNAGDTFLNNMSDIEKFLEDLSK